MDSEQDAGGTDEEVLRIFAFGRLCHPEDWAQQPFSVSWAGDPGLSRRHLEGPWEPAGWGSASELREELGGVSWRRCKGSQRAIEWPCRPGLPTALPRARPGPGRVLGAGAQIPLETRRAG